MQTGNPDLLSKYYYDAYKIYRQYCKDQYFIVAPEIFYEIPGTYRQQFMANSSYTKVLQDIHECVLAVTTLDANEACAGSHQSPTFSCMGGCHLPGVFTKALSALTLPSCCSIYEPHDCSLRVPVHLRALFAEAARCPAHVMSAT